MANLNKEAIRNAVRAGKVASAGIKGGMSKAAGAAGGLAIGAAGAKVASKLYANAKRRKAYVNRAVLDASVNKNDSPLSKEEEKDIRKKAVKAYRSERHSNNTDNIVNQGLDKKIRYKA